MLGGSFMDLLASQLSYIPMGIALCARKYFPRSNAVCQTLLRGHPQKVHG